MANGKFALLETFKFAFAGGVYRHRDSTIGNRIARQLFEDLLKHVVSSHYNEHVRDSLGVVNRGGGIHGKAIRRNDSLFGRLPAGVPVKSPPPGLRVAEGPVAEARIACEVKILAKAQQKQIDRVISDLSNFALRMKRLNKNCIKVAIVGVNHEGNYVGYEGRRPFRDRLRAQEPEIVTAKLRDEVVRDYEEFLILPFRATNQPPYPFRWLYAGRADLDYGAALTRIGELYQRRFRYARARAIRAEPLSGCPSSHASTALDSA